MGERREGWERVSAKRLIRALTLFLITVQGEVWAAEPFVHFSKDVPKEWLTPTERTDFRKTPRYAETVAYCQKLADASDLVHYTSFGKSGEGRDLPLLILAKDGLLTPNATHAAEKLVLLVQNCIHPGECCGKDASMMLARDIAITKKHEAFLDHVVIVFVMIFSPDGHERFDAYSRINQNGPDEMGWRVTSRNLNLNRDYVKADAVEMQALIKLWNCWKPDLHFDNHTTDGGDWQYDIMYAVENHDATARPIRRWLDDKFLPSVMPALKKDGHLPMRYFGLIDRSNPTMGIRSGGFSPRFSTGYAAIRNRPSVLVEMHMLKPYRTRVIGTYNIMLHALELMNREPDVLRKANQQADQKAVQMGRSYSPERTLPITIERTNDAVPFRFKGVKFTRVHSEISGDTRVIYDNSAPYEVDSVWFNETKVAKSVNPPLAYIIPPQWTEVIELLELHDVPIVRTTGQITGSFESYRFEDVSFTPWPYEGRFSPKYKTVPIVEQRTFPAGSAIVPLDHTQAKLAIHLLEPEAPDSLVKWGFFNAIFEQKEYAEHYILESLAEKMLKDDPKLREEFDKKLESDEAFRNDPRARLYFFYRRSPYWDERQSVYPVSRLLTMPKQK